MVIGQNDLRGYQTLKKELESLDSLIELTYNTYKSPALTSSGAGHSNDPGDPVTRALVRINKLKAKRKELLARIREIEDFVDNVDDSRERTILNYKYMQGLTWRRAKPCKGMRVMRCSWSTIESGGNHISRSKILLFFCAHNIKKCIKIVKNNTFLYKKIEIIAQKCEKVQHHSAIR